MDKDQARDYLDLIGATQQDLARAADCPPWRHVVFGLMLAALVLSPGLGGAIGHSLMLAGFAMLIAVVMSDRRRMGVFINGYRRGRTLPLTLALLGVTLGIIFAEIYAKDAGWSITARLLLAGVELVIATAASVIWQRIFRREMGLD